MSRYKVLFNNTLIFTISNFASKILSFLMLPLYTRVLSSEEFGSGDLVVLTVSLLMPTLTLSIAEGALRFALDENEDKKQVFSFGLKIIFIGFLLLVLLFPLILIIPVINDFALLFYLIYFSQTLNRYCNQFIRGINKIKLIGIVGVIQTFVTVVSNIFLLVVFKYGVEGFLLSIVIANTVAFLVLFIFGGLSKYIILQTTNKRLNLGMIKYSLPLTPNSLSWWLNNSANRYVISVYSGISELGLFSAASRIPTILITFQNIFMQAWQLSAITEFNKKNSAEFFSQTYKMLNFAMVVGCSVLILLIKPISAILFGTEFSDAWKLVPFLLISVIFGALSGFLGSINVAVKKTKTLFTTTLVGASIGVVLNLIFVPKYGAIAASVIAAISYFVIWIMRVLESKKYIVLGFHLFYNFVTYTLIVIQSIIILFSFKHSQFFAILCFLMIIIFNHKTLCYIAVSVLNKLNKYKI